MILRSRVAPIVILALLALPACHGSESLPTLTAVGSGPQSSYALAGVVRESLPSGRPVRDAVVQVIGKPGVIAATRSDADGRFTIAGVSGQFQLSASRPGYRTTTMTIGPVAADTSKDIAIEAIPRTVTGRVVETPPTQTKTVAGARVDIVAGAQTGLTATTDANGTYRVTGVSGDAEVRVTANGYVPSVQAVSAGDGDAVVDVQLAPEPRMITETISGELGTIPRPFSRTLDVHNAGELTVTDLSFYGFEEGDSCTLELWEGTALVARNIVERSFPRSTTSLRVPVLAGHRYELRITPSFFIYSVTFRYPS